MKMYQLIFFSLFGWALISCTESSNQAPVGELKASDSLVQPVVAESKPTPSLDESSFELITTTHKSAVENFHVWIKLKDYDEQQLNAFVESFKKIYCTKACNINLYDDRSVKDLIGKYPLNKKEYLRFADHFIATSSFDSPEIWMYPYQDAKYKEYGGKNWKKDPIK